MRYLVLLFIVFLFGIRTVNSQAAPPETAPSPSTTVTPDDTEPSREAEVGAMQPTIPKASETAPKSISQSKDDTPAPPDIPKSTESGFDWAAATRQSMLFLGVQHGYAMTQPKTRDSLNGPFVRDYFRSVGSLGGWADGGRFFTNYIAHPMQGAFLGFVQVQNDTRGKQIKFNKPGYWKSRAKALAWSAAWSTQFEIGPVSQASIGNVGLNGKQTYVDLVVTPTIGTAWIVAEDAVDQKIIRGFERRWENRYLKYLLRMFLNPTRTVANIVQFRLPWHREANLRR